jgi:hypothetical protein
VAPGRRALLVLVQLRRNEPLAGLATASGAGIATAHRYVTEVIGLLAELAPHLRQALRTAARKASVILDGTLIATHRLPGTGCTTRPSIAAMGERPIRMVS